MSITAIRFHTGKCRALAAFCLCLLVLTALPLAGQTIDLGSMRWKKISAEHYDVIYPDCMETKAQYVANSLEYLFPLFQDSLKPASHFRFPIILSPDYLGSNGFVTVAPRRSFFYTTPTSAMNGDWLSALVVHEGRHLTQFDAVDRNFVRFLEILSGEGALGSFAPGWFYEGDAVMTETALTAGGRGRDPAFTVQAKALLTEGKTYEYNKMLLGSDEAYTPDAYTFGYLMYAWIRSHYRMDAPEEFFRMMSWVPLPVLGPELGIKRMTGKTMQGIWEEMSAEMITFWKNQIASLSPSPASALLTKRGEGFTSYRAMSLAEDGSVFASRTNRYSGAQLVRITPGAKTARVITQALALNSLSSAGNLVAWDELVSSAKFDKSLTRIVIMDTRTGSRQVLGEGGRYLSPALSPDGAKLAVLEWQANYRGRFLVLDRGTGAVIAERMLPEGEYWSQFSWTPDGLGLVGIANGPEGKALIRIPADPGADPETLLPFSTENIDAPRQKGSTVFYRSNWSGINTIWAREADGSRWQVLQRPYQASLPLVSENSDRLIFADYADSRGEVVAAAPIDRQNWTPRDQVKTLREDFFAPIARAEAGGGAYLPRNVPDTLYPSSDFVFELQANAPASWGLSTNLASILDSPYVELSLDTANLSGIASQSIRINYAVNSKRLGIGYDISLRRLLPDLTISASGGWTDPAGLSSLDYAGSLGLRIPLGEDAAGGFWWSLVPSSSVSAANTTDKQAVSGPGYLPVNHSLYLGFGSGRWQFGAQGSYSWSPLKAAGTDHWSVAVGAVSPGLFAADRLHLTGNLEIAHDGSGYGQTPPRGWDTPSPGDAVKAGLAWDIPLLHPDIAFGPVFYWKGIDTSVFFDREWQLSDGSARTSAGLDLTIVGNVLQIPLPVSLGVRGAWRFETQDFHFDFLLMNAPFAL